MPPALPGLAGLHPAALSAARKRPRGDHGEPFHLFKEGGFVALRLPLAQERPVELFVTHAMLKEYQEPDSGVADFFNTLVDYSRDTVAKAARDETHETPAVGRVTYSPTGRVAYTTVMPKNDFGTLYENVAEYAWQHYSDQTDQWDEENPPQGYKNDEEAAWWDNKRGEVEAVVPWLKFDDAAHQMERDAGEFETYFFDALRNVYERYGERACVSGPAHMALKFV